MVVNSIVLHSDADIALSKVGVTRGAQVAMATMTHKVTATDCENILTLSCNVLRCAMNSTAVFTILFAILQLITLFNFNLVRGVREVVGSRPDMMMSTVA